jgi:hypothetical protein
MDKTVKEKFTISMNYIVKNTEEDLIQVGFNGAL